MVGLRGEKNNDEGGGRRKGRKSSRSNDEFELVRRDSHGFEDGEEEVTVVGDSVSDESEGSLLRVEEGVDIWRRKERKGGQLEPFVSFPFRIRLSLNEPARRTLTCRAVRR